MRQPLELLLKLEPYALSTLPERRQRVQTFIDLGVPSTTTLTLCTLACCVVSARLEICERVILIFLPKNISFWQTSHLAMQTPPVRIQMPKNNTTTHLRVQQVFTSLFQVLQTFFKLRHFSAEYASYRNDPFAY